MKRHHEYVHARQLAKRYNITVEIVDTAIALLNSELADGTKIESTVEELKAAVRANTENAAGKLDQLKRFNDAYSYDTLDYTSISKASLSANKMAIDELKANLDTALAAPQIKDTTKLATLAATYTNPIDFVSPVERNEFYGNVVTLNDLLDAASYVLHDINPDTGQPLNWTDEQKRTQVRKYLKTYGNLKGGPFAKDSEEDVAVMHAVADYVSANLDTEKPAVIGDYIDSNVEKVPVLRRAW